MRQQSIEHTKCAMNNGGAKKTTRFGWFFPAGLPFRTDPAAFADQITVISAKAIVGNEVPIILTT